MSQVGDQATISSLLDRVRQIEPVIRAHAADAESERRLHDAVGIALRENRLYHMWRPKVFGGLEVDPMTAFHVFEEVSRIDSAAGWNVMLSCGFDPFGAWFPDEGAEEIFGQQGAVLGGSFFPPRKAIPVDGGYHITGQTPFVSGAYHLQWFLGLAHVFDGETPRLGNNGEPVTLITACPSSDAVIIDTWRTLGMRGTGSHGVLIRDAFVPERRAALLAPLENAGKAYQGPLYKFTIWASVAALAAVATGIARSAIDDLVALAATKTPSYTARALRDRSTVQALMGEAEATLGAARAYLYEALREVWNGAVNNQMINMPGKIKLQLSATHAVIAATKVVDLVQQAAGTTGIRDEYSFQRYFRDVHTISQHGFASASRYESSGQFLLGVPIEWPFFGL